MRFEDHALDTAKLKGIWWSYATRQPCEGNQPHASEGCFLIVPHIGSGFDVALQEEQLPYLEMLRKSGDSEEHAKLVEDMLAKTRARAVARTILRGWANWEMPEGTPLVWSEDQAAKILSDRRWLAIAQFVEQCSLNTAAAQAREEEQAKGN